jgi:hypothetical protein
MVDSARRGALLWKSSSLATFYHPLTHDGRTKLGTTMHPRDMEMTAAEMIVRWERRTMAIDWCRVEVQCRIT